MRSPRMTIPLVLLAVATLAGTQDPARAPEFPAKAELVRLDIVVRDKSGRLVDDLRADEVQVLEDGKPCAVESFRLVQAEGPPPPRPAPAGAPATPAPLPVGPGDGLVTVVGLVFDQLGPEAAKNARAAALQLAGRSFPKGSVFAVFKIGQGLSVLQSFTEDRARLAPAIEKATTGVDQARDPARSAGHDNATEEAYAIARQAQAAAAKDAQGAAGVDAMFLAMEARMLRFSDQVTREAQGQASLQPLLAIAHGLALVQGRKSLLYFSEGLTVPPAVEEVFRATVSAANRANVSVYAFDARGLRARSPSEETKLALGLATESALGEQQGGGGLEGMLAADTALDALRLNRQGVLRDLAESTGGFLVAETNDLRPGLERVVSDLRAYYEVGYAPPDPKSDGRWRAISVKVSRPGVVVRTRRGYYALPPGAPVVLPYELPLAEALAVSPMPRDVEHRAATLRFAGGEAETEILVWVEVPLAGLSLTRDETTYRGHVSLLGQVKDEKGALVARMSHDAPIAGPLAEIESARQRTTVVERTLRLPPGRYVLETAVQDRESGRVGARRTAFEIPALGPSLSLGSVAIVRADDVGPAAPAPDDPLRAGALHATPLLGRTFPEGTPAVSLLLSLYAVPSPTPPEVQLEFRRDGQAIAHAKPELPAPDAGGRITYIGRFQTASLAPGRYEVWARGRLGDAEATEVTGFTLTPRPPLVAAAPVTPPAVTSAATGPGAIEDRKGVTTPLTTILERAGRYVRAYEETFRNLVAEESYRQWGPDPRGGAGQVARTLRSDLVFVRLPGLLSWGTFRDVYEVDGQKVRDREGRLEKLFFAPKASEFEQAEAILNESSRYNLGRAYRNINVPALGLLFLRPENQPRLAFKRKGTRTIAGFPTVEVAFEEKASPTLVHDRWGNDVPASGRFWIDETRGAVLRTEITYDLETDKTIRSPDVWERGFVSTEYRREPSLGCFVPDTMTELYNFQGIGRIDAVARYSSYRRFEVSVGTAAVLPLTYGNDVADTGRTEPSPSELPSPPTAEAPPAPARPPVADLPMLDVPERAGAVGELLQKAGAYVVRYEQAFRHVVATELYEQRSTVASPRAVLRQPGFAENPRSALASDAASRTGAVPLSSGQPERLRSEVVFAMLPGLRPWTLFRDVLELNGRVRRPAGRLEALFRASPTAAVREAAEITFETSLLVLGPTERTISVPTAALACLHPDERDAFAFKRKSRAAVGGDQAVEIAFEEVRRPTLNQDGAGRDVPLRGAFWVREGDGVVLRSRTALAFAENDAANAPAGSMTVTTEYRDDSALGLRVPVEMIEVLEWRSAGVGAPVFHTAEGHARYSGFRRITPGDGP
jgi:VWFA-related protein